MAASDFVDWYWSLDVGSITVSLNKYAIGFDNTSEKAKARQSVLSAARQKGLAPDLNAFARANCGKVSPDDCEHILGLALDAGQVKEVQLQSWADKNLGVDCTGFAVAYYSDLGLIDIDRYVGGASCFTLLNKAVKNNRASDGGPLIWSIDDVEADDMILWMTAAQVETRKPGHIAIVDDPDPDHGILYCAESNGSDDGQGHRGPRRVERQWGGEQNEGGRRYVRLGNTDRVIIVRPPPVFG
jgi:hypothetical protein